MSSIDEIASYTRELAEIHGHEVTELIVYGSYADGTQTEDSDIDIIVVSPDFVKDYHERAPDLHFDWDTERYPIPDIIPLTPEEFEYRRTAEGDVVRDADRGGIHY